MHRPTKLPATVGTARARLCPPYEIRLSGKHRCVSRFRRSHMRRLPTVVVAALLGLAWAGIAAAQGYPARAITMIVPFPAGGATDTLARFLAQRLRAILPHPAILY